ncbi:BtrH N-terminal domain-containing protein [Actinoplanes regularis]|uniref:Butirosin biosynthesis protein H, N-terminal n=1 Tax=Actinoplanes regularis TaxID=52697 RepID=A0A239FF39_9ACTN|nr:BtrH N-terminal domain-containing protein [Actinoplanes regularis]GIE89538.1 lantibiotic ABC transporter [Actinoplanes regularis]SNS54694.1 Butirosin biosynthesis protein H, N-terminal [Actinoplanes regularis]
MIIEDVAVPAGQHCETTALGVLLRQAGWELSEPMLFGLGEGLGFVYWDARNLDFPFLGGRSKPMTITHTLAERLGLTLRVEQTASTAKAWRNVTAALDAGRPVGLQLDCYHLEYFTTKTHFGGHVVAMYGYDDTYAYLIDTAQQGGAVTTSRPSLELARGERGPMTGRNLSFTLDVPATRPELGAVIRTAIRGNADVFLNPPIANLGHRGIAKAAARVPKWFDRSTDPKCDLPLAAMLMERGGTGGALFRAMYRDFLAECATVVDDDSLRLGQRMYAEIAPLWTEVAALITAAGESGDPAHLARASQLLTDLAAREHTAMRTLSQIQG